MVKNIEKKIESALNTMLNDVDKLHLRHLQEEMHKCAAKCCEDRDSSVELVHACIEVCGHSLKKAQKVVQNEFLHFQKQLQDCVLTCNNEAKEKLPNGSLDQQIRTYSSAFDACVGTCVDTNIALIPSLMKNIREALASHRP